MSLVRSVSSEWTVDSVYQYAAKWPNRERLFSSSRFSLDLAVVRATGNSEQFHRSRYFDDPIVLGGVAVEKFVLDTGTSITLITKALAERLDLPVETQPRTAQFIDGQLMTVVGSEILINVGSKWVRTLCAIPVDASVSENLLGLNGLFDDHLFCVDRQSLHLFRRRECSHRKHWP